MSQTCEMCLWCHRNDVNEYYCTEKDKYFTREKVKKTNKCKVYCEDPEKVKYMEEARERLKKIMEADDE